MRILVLGGSGMLGHKLLEVLDGRADVWATIRNPSTGLIPQFFQNSDHVILDLDVRNVCKLEAILKSLAPDVVFNSVGIVKQKQNSKHVLEMLEINSMLPHSLARLAGELGFRLITISTDCVFSGTNGNYSEGDVPDSLDLYGQSKHWGEIDQANCLTIRTSLIGRELGTSHGLAEWFIDQKGSTVKGYSQAIFSGFPTIVFADIIVDIIENHPTLAGVFHVSSEPISKYDLLRRINSALGLDVTLNESDDLVIDRSLDSSKFRSVTGFEPPGWDTLIEAFAADSRKYDK